MELSLASIGRALRALRFDAFSHVFHNASGKVQAYTRNRRYVLQKLIRSE